jgi:hypothetical protein
MVSVFKGKVKLAQVLSKFFEPATARFSFMICVFSFVWKTINNVLLLRRKKTSKLNGAISGAFAGLAILVLDASGRNAVAQQLFVRGALAGYKALHTRRLLSIPYGDVWLFAGACGSIMYPWLT